MITGGVTKLSINTKLQTLFKLLGLFTFCLATISVITLNLLSDNYANRTNAVNSTNNNDVTNADKPSLLATTTNNDGQPYISLSITNIATGSIDDPNLVLQIPHEGGIATGGHTLTIKTDSRVDGYDVTLSSTSDQVDLVDTTNKDNSQTVAPTTGTLANKSKLADKTWGYSLNSNAVSNRYGTVWTGLKPSTTPDTIASKSKAASTSGDKYTVYYGARMDNLSDVLAGDYQAGVVYTATAKLPPAPQITAITPDN